MLVPKPLQQGDTIAIICTARFVESKDLETSVKLFESWGLKVILGRSVGQKYHQFAGTDKERAYDLQQAIEARDINAICIAKGGYGTARILDLVNFSSLLQHPKWVIGYSDVTALHLKLQQIGLASLHADMPTAFSDKTTSTLESLKACLFNHNYNFSYQSKFDSRDGVSQGTLMGGNLSVLYSVLGTDGLPSFSDCILFLEDLDEYLYHIDRMLLNLKRNGILSQLSGLIVGGMSSMHDNAIAFGFSANQIIAQHVSEYSYPVAYNCPSGHLKENLSLLLGAKIQLSVKQNAVDLLYI